MSTSRRDRTAIPTDEDGGGGGHGGGDSRWLVTYADLLTLLMVLFLVLWVISSIDLAKFEKFKSGLGDFGNPAAASSGAGAGAEGDEVCITDAAAADDGHGGEAAATDGHGGEAAADDGHSSDAAAADDGHSSDTAATDEAATDEGAADDGHSTDEAAAADDGHSTDEAAAADDGHSTDEAAADDGHGGSAAEPDPCLGPGDAGVPGAGGGTGDGTKGNGQGAGGALGSGDLPEVAKQIQDAVSAAGFPDVVSVSVQERGLVVIVTTDNVLFGSGAADITGEGASMIGVVASTLNEFTNRIVVEGHTDKRPLRREGYDNWDLSVDRAVSVIKLLRDQYGIDSDRLTAAGFGERRPIAEGDDEASLARNRRVEIVVLAQTPGDYTTDPDGQSGERAKDSTADPAATESATPSESDAADAPAEDAAAAADEG
jgi:chemotaxis protein MotB